MRQPLAIALATSLSTVTCVHAGTVFTTYISDLNTLESALARIDPGSGVVTEVGLTGAPRLTGLVYDDAAQTMYAVGRSTFVDDTLFTIDLITGQATKVGLIGTFGIGGLAIDPVSGALFGSDENAAVYVIDKQTGAPTFVSQAVDRIVGMTFDTSEDRMLYSAASAFNSTIGILDPLSGAQTPLGNAGMSVQGLAYDPDNGSLYGVAGFIPDPPGGYGNTLARLDPLTGQPLDTITLSRTEIYTSLAVVPIPGPGTTVAAALLPLLASRRRRR